MGKFFKFIVIVAVIISLVYIGISIFANCRTLPGEYKVPDRNQAKYELMIRNTGSVLFTDAYDIRGEVITLKSYWEVVGNRYKYRDQGLTLDKKIFGEIFIRRR